MATFAFYHDFVEDLGLGVHNLSTGSIKVVLHNTDAAVATAGVYADITPITAQNGYSAGGPTLDSEAWAETAGGSGIWQFTAADEVLTASGGSFGPFRYASAYNDTPTSPADPLIGKLDYGSSITVTDTNTFTLDIGSSGIFRVGTGTIT
jgi:hypothetical protein